MGDNQLVKMVDESGLGKARAAHLIDLFSDVAGQVAGIDAMAREIVVTDESETAKMKAARALRLDLKAKRVSVEKTRKELKADLLVETRAIDSISGWLKGLIEPIEKHLDAQEHFVEYKRKAEEEDRRRKEEEALREKEERERLEREAEEKRVREENERKRKEAEAEAARLRKEVEERERERKEAEAKARREREAAEAKARAEREAHEKVMTEQRRKTEDAERERNEYQRKVVQFEDQSKRLKEKYQNHPHAGVGIKQSSEYPIHTVPVFGGNTDALVNETAPRNEPGLDQKLIVNAELVTCPNCGHTFDSRERKASTEEGK